MNHYSQNDEQEVILNFFGDRTGAFLDIGAYDGLTFSNTKALLQNGWSGVMVEPNPRNVTLLLDEVYSAANRVRIISAAVSSSVTLASLCMDETSERGWASSIAKNPPSIQQLSPIRLYVPTIHPRELISFGLFQFISIDAEYMDFSILMDMPRDLMGCELLCIEPSDEAERTLMKKVLSEEFGFVVHHETPENLLATPI